MKILREIWYGIVMICAILLANRLFVFFLEEQNKTIAMLAFLGCVFYTILAAIVLVCLIHVIHITDVKQ